MVAGLREAAAPCSAGAAAGGAARAAGLGGAAWRSTARGAPCPEHCAVAAAPACRLHRAAPLPLPTPAPPRPPCCAPGERHLPGGLHRGQAQVCALHQPQRGPLPEAPLPQGAVPHCGEVRSACGAARSRGRTRGKGEWQRTRRMRGLVLLYVTVLASQPAGARLAAALRDCMLQAAVQPRTQLAPSGCAAAHLPCPRAG